jgi:hypothetical protein
MVRARRNQLFPDAKGDANMKDLFYVLPFAVLTLWTPTLSSHDQEPQEPQKAQAEKPDPKKVKELMRRKLENSQKVLEALALNDLDKAATHAEALLRIQKEAAWNVHKTKQYEMWSGQFRASAEDLIKAAKEKNLESAKLNYLGMTMACFHCHSYVRDQGMTRLELEPRDH